MLKVSIYDYNLPFISTFTYLKKREGIIIKIEDEEGNVGLGDCAPLHPFSTETLSTVKEEIHKYLTSSSDIEGHEMTFSPSLMFAVESAYLSLMAQQNKCSMNSVILKNASDSLPVHALLHGSIEDIIKQIKSATLKGITTFKLKVSQIPLNDVLDYIKKCTQELPSHAKLRLDANQCWDLETAIDIFSKLDKTQIEFIEEPLISPEELLKLKQITDIPLAIDETLQKNTSLNFHQYPHIDVVIIKPMFIGGTSKCLEIAQNALASGKKIVFTSSFESDIGCLITAHLASTIAPSTAHGVASHQLFKTPLLKKPIIINDGQLKLHSNQEYNDTLLTQYA